MRRPEQVSDVIVQLLRLSWEIRISRDHLLKTAEGLPSSLLERAQETAEMLMDMQRKVRETSAMLPADAEVDVPEKVSDNIAGLRHQIELTLRSVDLLIKDVREVLEETPVLKTN